MNGMHKSTKAQDFTKAAKEAIADRDSFDGWPCCVNCGRAAPERLAWSNAHYISRAQGGLGAPENGLTLCPQCHARYDQSADRERLRAWFRQYLAERHPGWDEEKLYWRK